MQKHTLRELDAHFIRAVNGRRQTWRPVKSLERAQGVQFTCPVCFERVGAGAHPILLWFDGKGVTDGMAGGAARWTVSPQSTSLDDLTFIHGVPVRAKSVGVGYKNEHAHFFIEGGMVVNTSQDLHEPEVQQ